jgi:hypothetical protein
LIKGREKERRKGERDKGDVYIVFPLYDGFTGMGDAG